MLPSRIADDRYDPMRPWSPSYWFLLWELTRTEFKLRDQGTVLGFLWTLLHPALMFVVLYALFIKWLGRFVDQYAAHLIVGLVQWQFFEKATNGALNSLRKKVVLIRNFKFPLEIIVFSSVAAVFWSYLLESAVLVAFLLGLGLRPVPAWALFPALVAVHLAFTLCVSLILALLAVEFQDLDRVWGVLTTAGFYLTPVFYPVSIISDRYGRLMGLNPLANIIGAFRSCLVPGHPWEIGGLFWVVPASLALICAAVLTLRRQKFWITDRILEP